MEAKREIIAARVGDRVKVLSKDGRVLPGVIERIDNTKFPGSVFVRDSGNVLHEVQVGIGFADAD